MRRSWVLGCSFFWPMFCLTNPNPLSIDARPSPHPHPPSLSTPPTSFRVSNPSWTDFSMKRPTSSFGFPIRVFLASTDSCRGPRAASLFYLTVGTSRRLIVFLLFNRFSFSSGTADTTLCYHVWRMANGEWTIVHQLYLEKPLARWQNHLNLKIFCQKLSKNWLFGEFQHSRARKGYLHFLRFKIFRKTIILFYEIQLNSV